MDFKGHGYFLEGEKSVFKTIFLNYNLFKDFLAAINGEHLKTPTKEIFLKESWNIQELLNCNFNERIDIVIYDLGGPPIPHPVHMHGHSFHVMYLTLDKAKELINCSNQDCTMASWKTDKKPTYDDNPIQKDTIIIPNGGLAVVRIKADNPGNWFMHCHIDRHTEEGMAMVIIEWNDQGPCPPPPPFPKGGKVKTKGKAKTKLTSSQSKGNAPSAQMGHQ